MVEWFEACLSVKIKQGLDKEYLKGLASAFFNLHFYASYGTNTIVIIGDSEAIDNAVFLLRNKYKSKILTSCYSAIEYTPFQSHVTDEKVKE